MTNNIDILGKKYTLQFKTDTKMKGLCGTCEYSNCKIEINNEIHKEQQLETILHESLHALSYELQLGLKENQIRSLSVGFFAMMRHNSIFKEMCQC